MTRIEITEIVPCPDQEMDVPVDDCIGCEYYVNRENDAIECNFKEED